MSRVSIEQTGSFEAKSENGDNYTILIFTEMHQERPGDDSKWIEGLKSLKTSDGTDVNRVDKGEYLIMDWEEIRVFSDDPEAL